MTVRPMPAGGRPRARRFLLPLALGLSVAAAPGQGVTAAADGPEVRVDEQRGDYTVHARFTVAQQPPAVLDVLTAYEQIPRFMPDVKTSTVRARSGDRVLVEQEAVSGMLMFSKRIHLLLEVWQDGGTLRFRDASGRSFARYEGAWHVTTQAPGSLVTYDLQARPAFRLPDFFLRRVLKRDAVEMVERLRAEIARHVR